MIINNSRSSNSFCQGQVLNYVIIDGERPVSESTKDSDRKAKVRKYTDRKVEVSRGKEDEKR